MPRMRCNNRRPISMDIIEAARILESYGLGVSAEEFSQNPAFPRGRRRVGKQSLATAAIFIYNGFTVNKTAWLLNVEVIALSSGLQSYKDEVEAEAQRRRESEAIAAAAAAATNGDADGGAADMNAA